MIADVARQFGGEVPFLRPSELAQDDTPVWEAVRHALYAVEEMQGTRYDSLLLLDPTVPARMPEDIERAFERLWDTRRADGIVGVSQPEFDPISCGVVERDGWVTELVEGGAQYTRRQDVPSVYLINATLYIWRTEFVRQEKTSWRKGRLLIYQIPDHRVVHTDDIFQFERADVLIKSGFIKLPWLKKKGA
jgi:N-acylneuraminate cytidylyltransferase